MLTRKSTFEELMSYPGMEKVEKYIFQPQGKDASEKDKEYGYDGMKKLSFEQLCSFASPAWNPDSMADGFNHIAKVLDSGIEMELPIYTKEEVDADWTKERVGLLQFPVEKKGPFALVCAGGAYTGVASLVEAFPVARRLNEMGITAFVLQYRAGVEGAAIKSGEDIRRAITYILEHHEELHVTEEYAAFGFSAGGHLVAMLGTENEGYKTYGIKKPGMLGLCYPFVAGVEAKEDEFGMSKMMFGEEDCPEIRNAYTVIEHLDVDYPKTFIWQTVEDEQVPYEKNGLEIYKRLKALGVPCKLKEVAHGMHGLGIGKASEAEGWLEEAVAFWFKDK